MKFIVRKARPSDSKQIYEAHQKSIREICISHYSPEQIEGWAGFDYVPEHWPRTMEKDFVWVVEVEGKVQGFGHFTKRSSEVGEIEGLYLAPQAKNLGVGKIIVQEMLAQAKSMNLSKLVLGATKNAKGFYEKMGFSPTGEMGFLKRRGQEIEYFLMELHL